MEEGDVELAEVDSEPDESVLDRADSMEELFQLEPMLLRDSDGPRQRSRLKAAQYEIDDGKKDRTVATRRRRLVAFWCVVLVMMGITGVTYLHMRRTRWGADEEEEVLVHGYYGKKWRPLYDIVNRTNDQEMKTFPELAPLQGLAINEERLLMYAFHTDGARVFQLGDNLQIKSVRKEMKYHLKRDFPKIMHLHVSHLGGIDYVGETNEIWVAAHGDGLDGEGALFAVDPRTLLPIQGRVAGRVNTNLDWVAESSGILYFGVFFNVKEIMRVDLNTLEMLPSIPIKFAPDQPMKAYGLQYIQSASFVTKDVLVLLGDDYMNTIYFIDVKSGQLLAYHYLLLGNEADGLTFTKKSDHQHMFIGYNRQHSHEQVMGALPYISIIVFTQREDTPE